MYRSGSVEASSRSEVQVPFWVGRRRVDVTRLPCDQNPSLRERRGKLVLCRCRAEPNNHFFVCSGRIQQWGDKRRRESWHLPSLASSTVDSHSLILRFRHPSNSTHVRSILCQPTNTKNEFKDTLRRFNIDLSSSREALLISKAGKVHGSDSLDP